MSEAMLAELVSGICHVGRRVVRVPFYPVAEWLTEHPGLSEDDYKDWLLLAASLKDQLRKDGKVVQEVPFLMGDYRAWMSDRSSLDSAETRARYLANLSVREIRTLAKQAPLRPETPFGEVKVGDVLYLPVILEDDTALSYMSQLKGKLSETALAGLINVLADAVDLDLGVDEVSSLRCKGLEVNLYPRLVSSLDFDNGFGERHSKWLTDFMEQGISRGLPRAQALKADLMPFIGLSFALWGEAAQLGSLYGISLDVAECTKLEGILCDALGLPECECADTLLSTGEAVSGTLEYMGEGDSDLTSRDDDVDPLELDNSSSVGSDMLSLFGIDTDWNRIAAGSETTKKSKMGVVIPFRNRQ